MRDPEVYYTGNIFFPTMEFFVWGEPTTRNTKYKTTSVYVVLTS